MPIMSVSYDVVHANKSVSQVRGTACFSELFYGNHTEDRKLITSFWFEGTDGQRMAADWFIDEFVTQVVPERIKGTFEFDNVPPDYKLRAPFWKKLTVDLTKISGTDLYILLVLARYPQENPRQPKAMYQDQQENPDHSKSLSFIYSNASNDVGAGHTLIEHGVHFFINGGGKLKNQNYDLKDVWEKKVFKATQTYGKGGGGRDDDYTKPFPEVCRKVVPINSLFDPR